MTLDILPTKVILDGEKGACMVRKRKPGRPRDIINDDKISFRLPKAIKRAVERLADRKGIGKAGTLIRMWIIDNLDRERFSRR